jgi:hypothetical protein
MFAAFGSTGLCAGASLLHAVLPTVMVLLPKFEAFRSALAQDLCLIPVAPK